MSIRKEILDLYRLSTFIAELDLFSQPTTQLLLTTIFAQIGKLAITYDISEQELVELCDKSQDTSLGTPSRLVKDFLTNDDKLALNN